jgi:hypothetical protein
MTETAYVRDSAESAYVRVPIEEVERRARQQMGGHDNQPRATRDEANGDDITGPARRRGPMKAKRAAIMRR